VCRNPDKTDQATYRYSTKKKKAEDEGRRRRRRTTMTFSFAELGSSLLLFCLVFGMSGTVQISSLQRQLRNKTALLIGISLQFLILPAVGFLVVKIFRLPAEVGVILLVITSSPGGSYSNWWCSLFNAELALSVTMTTLSTLLSVIMLPLNLILYTKWDYDSTVVKSLDWSALIVSLCVVMGGIGGGLLASLLAQRRQLQHVFHRRANRMGNVAGILLITLSFSVSSLGGKNGNGGTTGSDSDAAAANGDTRSTGSNSSSGAIWNQSAKFYIALAIPAIVGLGIAIFAATKCQLEPPERVAVAVESCYQNTGIATSVAITLYKGDELATAIGVPLYYGIVEACILGIFCLVAWKFLGWTKAPKDENVCVMLYNSYEVDPDAYRVKEPQVAIEVVLDTTISNTSTNRGNISNSNSNNGQAADHRCPHDLIFAQTEQGGAYIVDEACLPTIQKQMRDKQVVSERNKFSVDKHQKHSPSPPPIETSCASTVALEHIDGDEEDEQDYDYVNLQEQQKHEAAAQSQRPQQTSTPVAQQLDVNERKGRRRQTPVVAATTTTSDDDASNYYYGQAPLGSPSPQQSSSSSSLPRPRLYSANHADSISDKLAPQAQQRPRTSSANTVHDVVTSTTATTNDGICSPTADVAVVEERTNITATTAEVVADRFSIAMSVIRARATGYQHATENEANCPRAPPSVLNSAAVIDDDDSIRPVAVVGRVID
jgi:predicted Na+-dependent transporter